MDILPSLAGSLLSPMVLAFALGVLATLAKSDLKFPDELSVALTIYLLFAIGLKGGMKLDGADVKEFLPPLAAGVGLCLAIPAWSFFILRGLGKFDPINAAAIAAHYGSVSAVTFSAALAFLDARQEAHEGFLPALLAVMEVPAIVICLWLARRFQKESPTGSQRAMSGVLHELFTGKGVVLLVGGMVIGLVGGRAGYEQVAPLFDAPFRGVLTLFLLEVGLVTGRRLYDLRKAGPFLMGFAVVMPVVHGLLGVALGKVCGLGVGGATVLGTLAASASYIAAPAAVRVALPQANPAFYLTAALAVTFPFNVLVGIPIYYSFARFIFAL